MEAILGIFWMKCNLNKQLSINMQGQSYSAWARTGFRARWHGQPCQESLIHRVHSLSWCHLIRLNIPETLVKNVLGRYKHGVTGNTSTDLLLQICKLSIQNFQQ